MVGERGFQSRIALTRSDGFPPLLQDSQPLVVRLCVPVQCDPALSLFAPFALAALQLSVGSP